VPEEDFSKIESVAIELSRPGLFAALPIRRALLIAAASGAAVVYGGALHAHGALPVMPWLVRLGTIFAIIAVRVWWVRKQGGPPPITVGGRQITLPTNQMSRRLVQIPLEKLRSVAVVGRGRGARLLIDTGWCFYRFPLAAFGDPDGPERLRAALRARITARPDGAVQWAAMEARSELGATIGRAWPLATLSFAAVVAVAYGAQKHWLESTDLLGLVHLGASSPFLSGADQSFRLVTANLLHMSPGHLLTNLAVLIWLGMLFERIAGWRQTTIVLLATGIAAQCASVRLGGALDHHIFSVGVSGADFGIAAALAAMTWRFGRMLPAAMRLPWPVWVAIVLLMLASAAPTPKVDYLAHIGGALAGFMLGMLLGRGSADVTALRAPGVFSTIAAAGLVALWLGAVADDVRHIAAPAARHADLAAIADGLIHHTGDPPQTQNDIAWTIGVDPDATPELLKQGAELADRAIASQTRIDDKNSVLADIKDTRAVLSFRLGDVRQAVAQELPLLSQRRAFGAHFAQFLEQTWRTDGLRLIGEAGPAAPTINLGHGVIQFTATESSKNGGRVYALLRRHDQPAGLLFFELPARFSGSQILPIPWSYGGPHTEPPPAIWTDPDSEIRVALFDRRGCFCKEPRMTPIYIPITADLTLPMRQTVATRTAP
jgi:membrane associated rhomboid family serine protease